MMVAGYQGLETHEVKSTPTLSIFNISQRLVSLFYTCLFNLWELISLQNVSDLAIYAIGVENFF